VTSVPAAAQQLPELAWPGRVRDRIDRDAAPPLDLQALANDPDVTAGLPSCGAKQVTRPSGTDKPRPPPRTQPDRHGQHHRDLGMAITGSSI
jgi:hypothetical protein